MAVQSVLDAEAQQSYPHQNGRPRLSAWEYLRLLAKATTIIPLRMALYILRIVFFSARRRFNIKHYVFCAIVNVVFTTFNDREIQIYSRPTVDAYYSWVNSKLARTGEAALRQRLVHEIQPLGQTGGSLVWVGNRRRASKVVLFLHGGGYVAPALRGHYEWCWNAYVLAGREAGVEVAVACLQYTLLNHGRFPVPLVQAAEALGSILDSGVGPSDVYVGGDSAGGNLAMQVVSHALHPYPGIRPLRPQLSEPLAGVFLVSPWLSNNVSSGSFKKNDGNDMISIGAVDVLGAALYGEDLVREHKSAVLAGDMSAANPYMTPLDTSEDWLDGIGRVVSRLYLTVGKNEVLYDHGVALVSLLRRRDATCKIRLDESEREAHDFILIENIFEKPGDATARMKAWFKGTLTES
ncbi:Alpha/beta hydrolase fold-3 [Metarhizium album ARSEF 1941]|uniref:Alpha/beta hydrolase fold-3 n=1 Tax=Metarhizium album (strain ARSEF 1941) TaxID=1081103 RepID=A0A0B2WRM1_METAS|nr:Alpha/beta hydrolase fold-3 [Metarhizium album ARSEF 1941]KHN98711.1 Alpha/beta hydrolase fold-3 [Metarhizium album ARSEF 1941]